MPAPESPLASLIDQLFANDPIADPAVARKARWILLDTLGCIVSGMQAPEVSQLEKRFAAIDAGVFRFPRSAARMAPSAAVWLAGIAACWDEACEGLARAHGRPGVPAIAATLPIAWVAGKSLGALLAALAVGYEIGGRLGEVMRMRPGMHVDATWPSFAAAAATSHLLGLNAGQAHEAIQLAASQMPFSLYAPIKDGANGRNTYLAHAAALGLTSALAVEAGFAAPRKALEETYRLALEGRRTLPELAPPEVSLLLEGYITPYAAARHVHYGAEAALRLRPRLAERLPAVTAMRLEIYEEAIKYCGNRAPRSAIQAQFSLSFGIAAALVLGDLSPEAYRGECLRDPEIRRLEQLVQLGADAERTRDNLRGARLTVECAGEALTENVDAVAGDPACPVTEAQVRDKFLRYATPALGAEAAAALAKKILQGRLGAKVHTLWA